jgi:hypothetical protein
MGRSKSRNLYFKRDLNCLRLHLIRKATTFHPHSTTRPSIMATEHRPGALSIIPPSKYVFPLLRLPPELILAIIEALALPSLKYSEKSTLYRRTSFCNLKPISLTCKSLRHFCISTGLLHRLVPKMNFPILQCGKVIDTLSQLPPLRSIGLNLDAYEGVRELCAELLSIFPHVDELVIKGSYNHRPIDFYKGSDMDNLATRFNGTSLVLRNLHMEGDPDHGFFELIRRLAQKKCITQVYMMQCDLDCWWGENPVFTNLETTVFGPCVDHGQDHFSFLFNLFVNGARPTRMEVTSHFASYCSGVNTARTKAEKEKRRKMAEMNSTHYSRFLERLCVIRLQGREYLKVLIDNSLLTEPFPQVLESWDLGMPPFQHLTLLTLRVEHLRSLQQTPSYETSCSTVLSFKAHSRRIDAEHHHSIWIHIAYYYDYCCTCDCILFTIETPFSNDDLSPAFWQERFQFLGSIFEKLRKKRGPLHYLVLRKLNGRCIGCEGLFKGSWIFRVMDHKECLQVLSDRNYIC